MSLFLKNIPIYYINLKNRTDRNELMLNQFDKFNIKNFKRIEAIDKNNIKLFNNEMSSSEIACSSSHLIAIKEFLKSTSSFALICEDDLDISNILKLNFSFNDFSKNIVGDYCLQTSVATREEIPLDFQIKKRSFWDFGTMSYIINRDYAEKLISNYFINNKISFDGFISREIKDPRGGTINTRPVADELIYSLCETLVVPIFTYNIVESDIGNSKEYYDQFIKNRNDFINYWSNISSVDASVLEIKK